MRPNYLIAMGFRGKLDPLGVDTLEAYQAKDKKIRDGKLKGFPLFTPIVEFDPTKKPTHVHIWPDESLEDQIAQKYKQMCDPERLFPELFYPGPFGDFIQLHKTSEDDYNMFICRKAFHKPGLAADLAVVVKGLSEEGEPNYHLVTGVRKANPGKGQPAWLGGFRNVDREKGDNTYKFDSSAYTLLHEAIEEAGLKIIHADPKSLRTDYTADNVGVVVRLGKEGTSEVIEREALMRYMDTIPTSDLPLEAGGEILPDSTKRVYATTGYFMEVDVGERVVNNETLSEWLTPGDDIGKLQFYDITREVINSDVSALRDKVDFGIEHHNHFLPILVKQLHDLEYVKYGR